MFGVSVLGLVIELGLVVFSVCLCFEIGVCCVCLCRIRDRVRVSSV